MIRYDKQKRMTTPYHSCTHNIGWSKWFVNFDSVDIKSTNVLRLWMWRITDHKERKRKLSLKSSTRNSKMIDFDCRQKGHTEFLQKRLLNSFSTNIKNINRCLTSADSSNLQERSKKHSRSQDKDKKGEIWTAFAKTTSPGWGVTTGERIFWTDMVIYAWCMQRWRERKQARENTPKYFSISWTLLFLFLNSN